MLRAVPGLRSFGRPGAALGGVVLLVVVTGGAWLALGRGGNGGAGNDARTALAVATDSVGGAKPGVGRDSGLTARTDEAKPQAARAPKAPAVVTMGESSGAKPPVTADLRQANSGTALAREKAAGEQSKPAGDAKTHAVDGGDAAPDAPEGRRQQVAPPEHTDIAKPQAAAPSHAQGANVNRSGSRLQAGLDLVAQNKPVEARAALSAALTAPDVSEADADRIRLELGKIADRLVFGTEVVPGDPYAGSYTIQSGDALARIPKSQKLAVDWRFLQRINKISAPERIQVGQRIKTVKGPFHAVVSKRDYRMDIYLGNGPEKVYVRSYAVGLGEYDSTPEGVFIVKPNSKLVNPQWTNPRTGERFPADDPKNPIGERWIGLEGVTESLRDVMGIGIHGTIDPDSIGQQRSMGCIRMKGEDVAVAYELLMEGISTVEVRGE